MITRRNLCAGYVALLVVAVAAATLGWTPVPVANDPLVRMPGTQPRQTTLEDPTRCMNCHAGYNTQVEPGFNWRGSMMAQAARDFIFWACMVVAAQDSIHAVGRPNAVDLCERCHFPKGWLEGRSDPPNASAMTGADYDGVHCDACHRQFDPFFETTHQGTREGSDWLNYWDETNTSSTTSQQAAAITYDEDILQANGITLFKGGKFFVNKLPFSTAYTENGAGQYYVSGGNQKRASFADANAKHQMLYTRYHKSKFFCGTCHDVSNPALHNLSQINVPPNDGTTILNSEKDPAFSYFHVERTFSEFRLSAYGQQGGSPGVGPFAPAVFNTSLPGNNIARCQDCHMRDVVGVGCNKAGAPIRPTESIEHPKSGQPLHDLTGGNIWVSYILASSVLGSPNYDATNASILRQGPAILTMDLTQGDGIDAQALLAGADRAKQQLDMAAAIEGLAHDPGSDTITFRVRNQTGHRLTSGFPEGRRIFANVKAYSQGNLIYQVNPYDAAVGTLKGLSTSYSPNSPPLGPNEAYLDELVYETHPTSTLTGETETFHFALATGRYKDNRIPPKGYRIGEAAPRMCEPVWHGTVSPDYFTAAEYLGGYDEVTLSVPAATDAVEVSLYYQVTSREYMEFLRDEIKGNARQTLPPGAYIAQTDPFFSKLKAWGDAIWQLWTHNMNVPGASPYMMTQAAINIENNCNPPVPVLQYVEPGDGQATITWSDLHSTDPNVVGYKVYYDQAGKAQLVAQVGPTTTSYTDTGLTVGQLYCYKVTALYASCESAYSNILCAVVAPRVSIAGAKALPDNSWVFVDDAVVTAGSSLGWECVFVESALRTSGLKLVTADTLNVGQVVRFTGMVSRVDGEWQIASVRVLAAVAGQPLNPLGMGTRAIGNDPGANLQYLGINTTGLLVRTWGNVAAVISPANSVYVDDGTGLQDALGLHRGLRIRYPAGVSLPAPASTVSVTGISRVEKQVLSEWTMVNGQWYGPGTTVYIPSLWVRNAEDIQLPN